MPSREHVAIVTRWAAAALCAGSKRVESRFFRTRRAPLGRVRLGDLVHFKLSGGPLIGTCDVHRVEEWDSLDGAAVDNLRRRHNRLVRAPVSYWRARRRCRFGILIWVSDLRPAPARLRVPRQYGDGWIILPQRGGLLAAASRGRASER
jgi:hypothetical protein